MFRNQIVAAGMALGAALAAACSGQLPTAPDSLNGLPAGAGPVAASANAASVARASLIAFSTGSPLPGEASLVRTDAGVSMTLHAEDLVPGSAYTVWWVVFNDPASCEGPCEVSDVLANRGLPAVRFAAGHVIGGSGRADFGAHLSAGETGGEPCAPGPGLGSCGPGLLNARTAHVHLVVRTHGPAIPEVVNEQIGTFNGGCPPNACANVQAAVFEP